MQKFEPSTYSHRRKNILTGEWVLVSPNRTQRPWQGEAGSTPSETRPQYDPACYLCPGNTRANGEVNVPYDGTFVFTNDFSALQIDNPIGTLKGRGLLQANGEQGVCRVVNFSPRHDRTLAEMENSEIEKVVSVWQQEFSSLGSLPNINYVQIFENKGAVMGNSNLHPHCQIWAQKSIPGEPSKELRHFKQHFSKVRRSLLGDYLKLELKLKERIVHETSSFVVLVPFWAVWPYETMIISRRKIGTILQFTEREKKDFADVLRVVTTKYDNLFAASFPYSSGLHQSPTDGKDHAEWHFHAHFYPPLLRSANVKKFMVGYEMLAEPQRDLSPEYSATILRELSTIHYKSRS